MKEFKKVLKLARLVAKQVVCNHCLGRQFAHVSTGMTNLERGLILRKLLKSKEPSKCSVCSGIFNDLENYAKKVEKALAKLEFSTFLIGTRLSSQLIQHEEELWEAVGIEYCEPLKSEINRELGKLLQSRLKKPADEKPDILIILNIRKKSIELQVKPLFVYGAYKKLVRGIPQTKWNTYPQTVEDIIAKPFMKVTGASNHSLHGCGREDIDARCLDWRPFVLELDNPRKRKLPLKTMEREINKSSKVHVHALKWSDKKEVIKIKEIRPDKTYKALVVFSKAVKKGDLSSLKRLIGIINQKTPLRVLHRRTDTIRKRRLVSIKSQFLTSRRAYLEIRGEAGLYIKELVTGDEGRTTPSVSSLLGPAKVKELDVVRIHV